MYINIYSLYVFTLLPLHGHDLTQGRFKSETRMNLFIRKRLNCGGKLFNIFSFLSFLAFEHKQVSLINTYNIS